MNQNPKFQGFPLTRKTSWKTILGDAVVLVASVVVLGFIFHIGVYVT